MEPDEFEIGEKYIIPFEYAFCGITPTQMEIPKKPASERTKERRLRKKKSKWKQTKRTKCTM